MRLQAARARARASHPRRASAPRARPLHPRLPSPSSENYNEVPGISDSAMNFDKAFNLIKSNNLDFYARL
ncbi:hypothetical protein AXF42_Ash007303 [Apostasia shenzhenica]|uniref:Uncharacterized protein n=1 Tax=Apostasia shenzhenica TaxID=1088818 RepID=A0A2I0B9U1_9ASPA|nr:hypothetical protein AXF42_Ash007303 [Apostasia shenzhenica]